MPSPFHRKLQVIKRELWQRRLPHGLVSWRYFLPGADPRMRLHRRFWWDSGRRWPRPIWFGVEGWLWCRWVFWQGWRASWRTVRRLGPEVRDRYGISLKRQVWLTLRLALGQCIPPREIYCFRLYQSPGSALDYVYDHETAAYHAWRSVPLGNNPESLRCIQDKVALAERLHQADVPVVETHQIIAANSKESLASVLGSLPRAFCKTRKGNQGRGAFAVWRSNGEDLAGQRFDGGQLATTEVVEAAWDALLALDDVLVQPLLSNHPDLAPMAEGGEVITVRYISQWQGSTLDCLCATLEVPIGKDDSGRMRYEIMPIDVGTGLFQPLPEQHRPSLRKREQAEHIWDRAPTSCMLPHWPALVEASQQAHAQFPDICAIAWDWVITPEGPVLLEGNTGWGAAMPQILQGGFLRDITSWQIVA